MSEKSMSTHLNEAIELIDGTLGEGYAKKNPNLVGTIAVSMAQESQSLSRDKVLEQLSKAVEKLSE